jgi:hypothetical protein
MNSGEEDGLSYERPKVVDYGSIAAHTFTRCGAPEGPRKDFPDVPHHIDNHGECSALDGGGLS